MRWQKYSKLLRVMISILKVPAPLVLLFKVSNKEGRVKGIIDMIDHFEETNRFCRDDAAELPVAALFP